LVTKNNELIINNLAKITKEVNNKLGNKSGNNYRVELTINSILDNYSIESWIKEYLKKLKKDNLINSFNIIVKLGEQ